MDEKLILLEEIEKRTKEISNELEQKIKDIQMHEQYEEYDVIESAEERQERFPELYQMHEALEKLEARKDILLRECATKATEVAKGITEKIEKLEKNIDMYEEKINNMMEEIQAINREIEELKQTEEYKAGDEATLLKVEQLELELKEKIVLKNKEVKQLADVRKQIKQLEKEKNDLVEQYGEIILEKTVENELQVEENSQEKTMQNELQQKKEEAVEEVSEQAEKEVKNNEQPKQKSRVINARGVQVAPTVQEVVKEEKNEEKEEKKDPKEEFDELCKKAKEGTLDDKEFDKLVDIMKQPKNYDEFGITTGIIFNKSRGIFRTLEKYVGNVDNLVAKAKTEFAKELVGDLEGKELLNKVALLEKEGLSEEQQKLVDKVKDTLNKQTSLEQSKFIRDEIALKKNEKRWSWLIDFSEDKKRLSAGKDETSVEKSSGGIKDISNLVKTESEKDKSYSVPEAPKQTVERDERS